LLVDPIRLGEAEMERHTMNENYINLKPRIGVSACLLGQEVRYDGGHKRDRYLTDTLGEYFEWVAVCPEVELGLGTPRETIRLVQIGDEVRLRTTRTDVDLTDQMRRFAERRVKQVEKEDLSGYILKKGSPSCGMQRVKVHQQKGPARRRGRGLFAAALREAMPLLPVEDEGRLCDSRLRENWVERVFAYDALKRLFTARWTMGRVVDFHTRYKFALLAHSETDYRQLGRLVAEGKSLPRAEFRDRYSRQFMMAMEKIATPRKNANVLQHILGFFKKDLDAASRQELLTHIDDYRRGLTPLVVPITLLRHYVRLLDVEYLAEQVYLNPHPKELALRNHV
jgi:uncharacterized protein YbgA (DUF1722 family)/uncharacterized protein YbbK (DUF523 family)